MSETVEKLAPTLLALPEGDRLAIAHMLLDSIPHSSNETFEDDSGFEEELDRRFQDYQSGKSPAIPKEELFRQLRERKS